MGKKSRKTNKTGKQAIEDAMPDVRVVDDASGSPKKKSSPLDSTKPGPSMRALRAKSGGSDADEVDGAADSQAGPEAADDIEVVKVRSKQAPADPADDPGPRTIIVSKSKGILGGQG